jgi:hypothetical protein
LRPVLAPFEISPEYRVNSQVNVTLRNTHICPAHHSA